MITSHISNSQQPHSPNGYCIGQRRYRTFALLQKVLLDSAVSRERQDTIYIRVLGFSLRERLYFLFLLHLFIGFSLPCFHSITKYIQENQAKSEVSRSLRTSPRFPALVCESWVIPSP